MIAPDLIVDCNFFAGKVVGIFGATGFIGSHLVEALLASNCTVKAFGRNLPGLIPTNLLSKPNLSLQACDITDFDSVNHFLKDVDIVIHLASSSLPKESNKHPHVDVDTNLHGAINILDGCIANNIDKFVFISSGGTVYGQPLQIPIPESHPTNPRCSYGIVKLAIEKYCLLYQYLYGLNISILRLANPYGGRQRLNYSQGVVPIFLDRAMSLASYNFG